MFIETEEKDILRHVSGALINTDVSALERYRAEKRRIEKELLANIERDKKISDVQEDLRELKSDITEIREMLKALTNGS